MHIIFANRIVAPLCRHETLRGIRSLKSIKECGALAMRYSRNAEVGPGRQDKRMFDKGSTLMSVLTWLVNRTVLFPDPAGHRLFKPDARTENNPTLQHDENTLTETWYLCNSLWGRGHASRRTSFAGPYVIWPLACVAEHGPFADAIVYICQTWYSA